MVGERRRLRRRRGVGRGVARVATPFVIVAVLVVLAVGALSRIGPASAPDRRTVNLSYAVLAAPIVSESDASGSALNAILTNGPSLERTAFFSALTSVLSASASQAREFAAVVPPVPAGGVADGCGTAMETRGRAVALFTGSLEHLLGGRRGRGGGDEASAVRTVADVGTMLRSADASWASCRHSLRRAPGAARLPSSTWVRHPGVWSQAALGPFVAALVGSTSLEPVHHLTFVTISTDPAAVLGGSGVSVLPPTRALRVTVVVADQGNVDERGVTVVVSATPQGTARVPAPTRTTTDIAAGHSVALSPPPLSVRPGGSYVLGVTATLQTPGTAASLSLSVRVSAVAPTTTSTTIPALSTTTTTTPRSG